MLPEENNINDNNNKNINFNVLLLRQHNKLKKNDFH